MLQNDITSAAGILPLSPLTHVPLFPQAAELIVVAQADGKVAAAANEVKDNKIRVI